MHVFNQNICVQIQDKYKANLHVVDTKPSVELAFHQALQLSPVYSRLACLLCVLSRDATRDWRTRKCTYCVAAASGVLLKMTTAQRDVVRHYTRF